MLTWNEFFLPLSVFAFATSITPGPNNLMLTASGANFGFWRTVPHILGIVWGCALLLLCVGAGLGAVFVSFPWLQQLLRVVGAAYLLYLAWQIASAGRSRTQAAAKPMSFWQAAAFQFVNPKAWIMAVSAMTSFPQAGEGYWWSAWAVIAVFCVVNLPSVTVWAGFGTVIGRWLQGEVALRSFNLSMGGLTAASVVLLFV